MAHVLTWEGIYTPITTQIVAPVPPIAVTLALTHLHAAEVEKPSLSKLVEVRVIVARGVLIQFADWKSGEYPRPVTVAGFEMVRLDAEAIEATVVLAGIPGPITKSPISTGGTQRVVTGSIKPLKSPGLVTVVLLFKPTGIASPIPVLSSFVASITTVPETAPEPVTVAWKVL